MGDEKRKISAVEILKAVGVIVAIIASFYGVFRYIDWRIDQKINSSEFIRKIASNIHPSVIFDSRVSIEIDMGAMQFIENIKVIPSNDPRFPKKIVVSPKEYLAHAPLLTPLGGAEFNIEAERGTKFDWVYQLSISSYSDSIKKSRFRLEVVR